MGRMSAPGVARKLIDGAEGSFTSDATKRKMPLAVLGQQKGRRKAAAFTLVHHSKRPPV